MAATREADLREERLLVRRIVSGDPDALGIAFERYRQKVYRVAFGITRSVTAAEDVTHDIFVSLPEWLRTYEGRSDLGGWLYRVSVRTAAMYVRTERRRWEHTMLVFPRRRESAEQPALISRLALEQALSRIPPGLREVLWLRAVEGCSHAEIADLLGITVDASYQRFRRARLRMERVLDSGRGG